ncbi:hypothetical protein [Niallia sp. NCCP-28]|uniref:hypothetical protein n=1 Tax=Niallia sp. NCCP-28 TaxID=2934712 RepID=UPI0020869C7A|nr:hypothetical protein [Niallia sp. NCCP-28]GKU84555.1 hypothetical protein NCCP28_39510 [Niallia sp. NCCP-28]
MEWTKVPLNYAIMIEQIRNQGYFNREILKALQKRDKIFLANCGRGLPDWDTLINYYQNNPQKIEQVIAGKYEIAFLTKGTLKKWLRLKFHLAERMDYIDVGTILMNILLPNEDFIMLKNMLAKNWEISNIEKVDSQVKFNIVLANKLEQ